MKVPYEHTLPHKITCPYRTVVKHHDDYDDPSSALSTRVTERSVDFRQVSLHSMDDLQFHSNFRMSRSTYEDLLQCVIPLLPKQYEGFGQRIIPPEERLAMILWFLSSAETYRQLAARFGTTDSVVSYIYANLLFIVYFFSAPFD